VAVPLGLNGWQLRPRALALTIWARLLLADLFIHGIGGAKYDRISDAIIADYYGLTPPHMGCVSATLHLTLGGRGPCRASGATLQTIRALRHSLRDLQWNPQRNLSPSRDSAPLVARRAEAVRHASWLREQRRHDRKARAAAFRRIREINAALLAGQQDALAAGRRELERGLANLKQSEIARGREYFFGLFDWPALDRLLRALPSESDFQG
jgi:hypothetical protein